MDDIDIQIEKLATDRAAELAYLLEKQAEDLEEAIEQMALLKVACWVADGMEKEAGAKQWLAGLLAAGSVAGGATVLESVGQATQHALRNSPTKLEQVIKGVRPGGGGAKEALKQLRHGNTAPNSAWVASGRRSSAAREARDKAGKMLDVDQKKARTLSARARGLEESTIQQEARASRLDNRKFRKANDQVYTILSPNFPIGRNTSGTWAGSK